MYKIVFQNSDFIVVDKSANVLSVPSRMGKDDPRPCLGIQLEKDLSKQIYPVHRLDYEVSGLIMYALNPTAQSAGNLWFEKKEIQKTYECLAKKLPASQADLSGFKVNENYLWECMLAKGKKRAYEANHGKKSITEAKIIEIDSQNIYRLHLNPITGRSHQLRFEMYRHQLPIIGDSLYGSNELFENGIALRAFKIDFSKCLDRLKFSLPEEIKIFGF